ncbi:MAG: hypothetical protein GY833_18595 [Aestuariibacter sp.]|nr:hypothetical protein [Aestuariibacter sp.]
MERMERDEVLKKVKLARDNSETPDLSKAQLGGVDLSSIDLSRVNLSQAKLAGANLQHTKLIEANLSGADLSLADLCDADLSQANLSRADLRHANLGGAKLDGANLKKAKMQGVKRDDLLVEHTLLSQNRTKKFISKQEVKLRAETELHTDRPNPSPFPSPILPYRWEGLKREASKREVPLKPLIKPIPDAISRVEEELHRIDDTGMGRLHIISGITGSGKTTFLNSLHLFVDMDGVGVHNIKLRSIDNPEIVENALRALRREDDRFSIVVLEGKENSGDLGDKELDILLSTLNTDFRSDAGCRTLFVIPTTSSVIAERIGGRAVTIGGMTSLGNLRYVFTGPDKDEYFSIVNDTFRALNESRTLNDYGIIDQVAHGLAQSSQSIGSFIEGCYDEIQQRKEKLQGLSNSIKRKRIHLWMVFCSYEEDVRINYNTMRSLTVGAFQYPQVERLLVGDSKPVRFWKDKRQAFAQIALYLDLRITYLPLRTAVTIITSYGYKDLIDDLKNKGLIDRESTPARAQESLAGSTALGAFLQGKGFTDSSLTQRAFTQQQRDTYKEVSRRFKADEKTFNALVAETLRDWYKKADSKIVTELPLTDIGSPLADIAVVTPTDIYCLELKWRSDILTESEIRRHTVERVQDFAEELPELGHFINK